MPEISQKLVEKLSGHLQAMALIIGQLESPPEIPEDVQRVVEHQMSAGKCLVCGRTKVGKERFTRGLCPNHYNEAVAMWNAGLTTQGQLMSIGRLAPVQKGGRPSTQAVPQSVWTTPINEQLEGRVADVLQEAEAKTRRRDKPRDGKTGGKSQATVK